MAGDLNAALESYARYYEHVHGDAVDSKALIPEILAAFLQADREFQTWSRSSGKQSSSPPRSVFDQRQRQVARLTRSDAKSADALPHACQALTRHSFANEALLAARSSANNEDKPAIFRGKRVLRDVYAETEANQQTVENP